MSARPTLDARLALALPAPSGTWRWILRVTPVLARRARRVVRHWRAALERSRRAYDTRVALAQLDDRSLRDLGFTRDELPSIVAEVEGRAERTRQRVPG